MAQLVGQENNVARAYILCLGTGHFVLQKSEARLQFSGKVVRAQPAQKLPRLQQKGTIAFLRAFIFQQRSCSPQSLMRIWFGHAYRKCDMKSTKSSTTSDEECGTVFLVNTIQ